MSDKSEPKPSGESHAAGIRAAIDKLSGHQTKDDATKTPSNPRDFIQRWMAEHDNKPEEKK